MVADRRRQSSHNRPFYNCHFTLYLEVSVGTADGPFKSAAGQAPGLDVGNTNRSDNGYRFAGILRSGQ